MPKDYHLHLRGSVGGWNFDSDYISYILDKHKDREVNVLINSLGGDANEGLAINSLFKIHGNVHVHLVAMNASAATIAAMGAKRVTIDAAAPFLVHKCLNAVCDWDWMNADQLEERISELRKMQENLNAIDSVIAGLYARRCKKTKDEMMALMKVGGWLTPQQALEWGFVDEITDLEEDEKPVLTEAVASAICAAGMPMPPVKMDKGSFIDRLRKFILGESKADDIEDGIFQTEQINNTPQPTIHPISMKNFSLIAAILGGALASSGTKAEISEDQLDKIEASLSAKDTEIAALKTAAEADKSKIAELEQSVADLKKAPADDTSEVTEQAKADADGFDYDPDEIVAQLMKARR